MKAEPHGKCETTYRNVVFRGACWMLPVHLVADSRPGATTAGTLVLLARTFSMRRDGGNTATKSVLYSPFQQV